MSRRRIYPWEEWFARPRAVLERGVDYTCSQSNMVQLVRNNASNRGLRIRLTDESDRIVVEVVGTRGEVLNEVRDSDSTAVAR